MLPDFIRRLLLLRALVPLLQLPDKPGFGRRGEESYRCGRAYDGVEVDPSPDEQGGGEAQEDKGGCGEAEGRLGHEVGEDVVVDFILGGMLSVRC